MINRKMMWKIITVTMVALAVCIVVAAVGGIFMLIGGGSSKAETTDTEAPVIKAAKENVIIYTGETISYRSFVTVIDDRDEECSLSVDSTGVKQNIPGEYVVKYVATDAAGNKSKTFSLKVTVKDGAYSEDKLMKLVGQMALTELGYTKEQAKSQGKTKTQIVKDIYNYINDPTAGKNDANIYFNDVSNTPAQSAQGGQKSRTGWETDWIEEAYRTLSMPRMQGDCYTYYAVSKAFFEYFEIENVGIQRAVSSTESGTHYWNVVKVEGGWYYYDATRLAGSFADGSRRACLITESKLLGYKTSNGGTEFYKIDKWEGFPKISTDPVN